MPVAWLGADEGGYFPPSWGLPTLALLWVAMVVLVFGSPELPGRLSVAAIGVALALAAWIGLSVAWSVIPSQSVLELERALLYVSALVAALLLGRGRAPVLLGGVLAGAAGVCIFALVRRLVPHAFGVVEPRPFQTAALYEPVGYSNALGLLAALGVLLSLGFATHGRSRVARAAASGAVVPLATVVYFTFSRGAWLALAFGLTAAIVVAPARGRVLAAWVSGPLPLAAVAVLIASRADALAQVDAPLADAGREGALVFLAVAGLAAAAGAARLAAPRIGSRLGRGPARALVVAAVAVAVVPVVAVSLAKSRTAFLPQATTGGERTVSAALGRRDDFWRAGWNAFEEQPLTGLGAGAYEQYWLEHRASRVNVRDAHNLYVETLAELGPVGFALLATLLAIPLVAAARVQARPLLTTALGAFACYLAHAAVDWDWEVPVVTVSALIVGAALVAAADDERAAVALAPLVRGTVVAAALAASIFTLSGLIGNRSAADAEVALRAGRTGDAVTRARRAARWTPWSSHPLRTLAEAQLRQGRAAEARKTLLDALARDSRDWRLWLTLALATEGSDRREAFRRAEALNPHGRRIAELRELILRKSLGFERFY